MTKVLLSRGKPAGTRGNLLRNLEKSTADTFIYRIITKVFELFAVGLPCSKGISASLLLI